VNLVRHAIPPNDWSEQIQQPDGSFRRVNLASRAAKIKRRQTVREQEIRL
jgi:hypothetical protein